MSEYLKPDLRADYRVDAAECMDRAQRALELAEINLDGFIGMSNKRGGMSDADMIAQTAVRAQIGQAWRDLAALKSFETEK